MYEQDRRFKPIKPHKETAYTYANLYCALCRKNNAQVKLTLTSGEMLVGHIAAYDENVYIINTKENTQVMVTRVQVVSLTTMAKTILVNSTGNPAIFGEDAFISQSKKER